MSIDPKDFFQTYVLGPYGAWVEDELCEWKAFATVNGLNALIELTRLADSPGTNLGEFRRDLPRAEDHNHIRWVAEVLKHIERSREGAPRTLDEMGRQSAGAFSSDFSADFDVVREQLGFPFQATPANPPAWVPLRQVVDRCIDSWRGRFGL